MGELKKVFRPELLNRIDEVIVFHKLTKEEIKVIVELMMKRLRDQMGEHAAEISLTDEATELLVDKGYDPTMGARPLRRAIQRFIEDPLADFVLGREITPGSTILVDKKRDTDDEVEIDDHPGRSARGAGEGHRARPRSPSPRATTTPKSRPNSFRPRPRQGVGAFLGSPGTRDGKCAITFYGELAARYGVRAVGTGNRGSGGLRPWDGRAGLRARDVQAEGGCRGWSLRASCSRRCCSRRRQHQGRTASGREPRPAGGRTAQHRRCAESDEVEGAGRGFDHRHDRRCRRSEPGRRDRGRCRDQELRARQRHGARHEIRDDDHVLLDRAG